ncbi:transcriptional regulator GcvA [Aquabacter spiritensis]|uniref:DNA-binding transcriptional LysR family regulator n=1 Tax=Aquabacter spiritensis TaxID=933073 RepID=A0A4R3LR04_9HYPH|nr:transcriptional regulator GcvA [Aquabacter spiritensis]TCT02902.1 DNA-binding transcriptional LysR family regulator [Aquabacter spiritensis]
MTYRLPPLNALRLFEAAGRHLSFKQAADELHVTPSAVSHAIQGLEAWLGVELFRRGPRSLALTEAGEAYLPTVRSALAQLAAASARLPGRAPRRLVVSVAPTFGLRWLIPRLARFQAGHPDIEITLDTSRRRVDLARDGIDAAIRMGRGDWPDVAQDLLVSETLVPVCAPSLAPQIAGPGDLAGAPLLHVVNVAEDWAAWAVGAGLTPDRLDLNRGQKFDNIHIALEVAARGGGIAVGRLPLMQDDIAAGRLVGVAGPPVPAVTGYWLVTERESRQRPEIAAFRTWLRRELAPDQDAA